MPIAAAHLDGDQEDEGDTEDDIGAAQPEADIDQRDRDHQGDRYPKRTIWRDARAANRRSPPSTAWRSRSWRSWRAAAAAPN